MPNIKLIIKGIKKMKENLIILLLDTKICPECQKSKKPNAVVTGIKRIPIKDWSKPNSVLMKPISK